MPEVYYWPSKLYSLKSGNVI